MTLDELKSLLWGAAVLLRGKINATGYKEYIFPLVFFKRISDVHEEEYGKALELSGGDEEFARQPENYSFSIPDKCLWRDVREVTENIGQALVTAWTRIEQANPDRAVGNRVVEGLGGIFGKRDHWTNKNILTDETLSRLIEHFSAIDLSLASCPADEMGQAYEYLVGKFADDAGSTAQEFYTNRTVVELMAEILEPRPGESIYDPTCGTGGMLISCIARCKKHEGNWREIKAYGQEQNFLTSSVARMNLFLHGIEEFRIVNDDTLLHPGFLDAGKLKTFDVVLANPPYSIKHWNRGLFANDPFGRNFLGLPPQGRADYAFIQHILKSMNPKTGRCAILLPHGVLFREEEKHIRKALIESDLVEAMIGLAPNLFYNAPMEACVMVCRMNKPAKAKGRILFINAVGEVTRRNAESKLEPRHIGKILEAYRKRASDGRFAYDAAVDEIAAKDWSLAISLYAHVQHSATVQHSPTLGRVQPSPILGRVPDPAALLGDFAEAEPQAAKALESLAKSFGASFTAPAPSPTVQPSAIFGRVPSGDAAQRVKLGDVAEEVRGNWDGATQNVPIVGLEHLEPDEVVLRKWEINPTENTFTKAFREGQLLFGRRRAYQKKLSLAPCDGICSGDITVIAAKGDKVLPELLPFILRTDQFFDFAIQGSAGSLSPRVKWSHLAAYEFILPSLSRQRELADLLWAANDLKEAYKKAITATDEMLKAKFREMFGEGGADDSRRGAETQNVEFRECITDILGGKTPSMSNSEFYDGNVPFIKSGDVREDYISKGSIWLSNKALASGGAKYVPKGSVIIVVRSATLKNELRVAVAKQDIVINQDLKAFVPSRDYLPTFLMLAIRMQSDVLLGYVKTMLTSHIEVEEICKLKIPALPLSLQREFVAIAEKAEAAKSALKQSISTLDQIMKGLINNG